MGSPFSPLPPKGFATNFFPTLPDLATLVLDGNVVVYEPVGHGLAIALHHGKEIGTYRGKALVSESPRELRATLGDYSGRALEAGAAHLFFVNKLDWMGLRIGAGKAARYNKDFTQGNPPMAFTKLPAGYAIWIQKDVTAMVVAFPAVLAPPPKPKLSTWVQADNWLKNAIGLD